MGIANCKLQNGGGARDDAGGPDRATARFRGARGQGSLTHCPIRASAGTWRDNWCDAGRRPGNYDEGCAAESPADFVHKLNIALKELRESRVWLRLSVKANLLPDPRER